MQKAIAHSLLVSPIRENCRYISLSFIFSDIDGHVFLDFQTMLPNLTDNGGKRQGLRTQHWATGGIGKMITGTKVTESVQLKVFFLAL